MNEISSILPSSACCSTSNALCFSSSAAAAAAENRRQSYYNLCASSCDDMYIHVVGSRCLASRMVDGRDKQ